KVAESPEAAALMGLVAGIDIDLYAEDSYAYLPEMVKKDSSIEKMIDRSVRRVLRTKMILGLFDNPYVDIEKVEKEVRSETSLELAQQADLESIILLKNEANMLPLAKKQRKIALLGPLVDDGTKEAFEAITGNTVTYVADQGFELTDQNPGEPKLLPTDEATLKRLTDIAQSSDVVILFLGGDEFTSKEAYFNNALGDRATIEPVGAQDELLDRVISLGKPVIVVLKHRRTLAINTISEKANAILDGWDLSEFGDSSIAKIIFGEVSPSGKSPVTIPRSIGQFPFHYSMKEINKKKGYLFLEDGPLYPFGHGLSYGEFEYNNLKLSADTISPSTKIHVSVQVTNTGKIKAKEVVQMYLKDEIGSVTRPDKELKGFDKIELAPGESQTVSFTITPKMLEFTGLQMEKILESGDYTVMVGTSSEDGVTTKFRLEK
ncbi:MAG: glycoside hydrolase family 3 C-terminal domain-containing protein, partial [Croceitalea sp.]|nr:glycoside hydrolase family 3 C-terminal domain-containing protein [Croceitalea sp.]